MRRCLRSVWLTLGLLPTTLAPQIGVALLLVPAIAAEARADGPLLTASQGIYCQRWDPNWSITVQQGAPNSPVYFQEFKWNGSAWVSNWGPAYVGDTDGSGNFYWDPFGPDAFGHYYAQVEIDGVLSGPAIYTVTEC